MKDALIEHFAGVSPEARSSSYPCQEYFCIWRVFLCYFQAYHKSPRTWRGLGSFGVWRREAGYVHFCIYPVYSRGSNIRKSRIRLSRQRILTLHALIFLFYFEQVSSMDLFLWVLPIIVSSLLPAGQMRSTNTHFILMYTHFPTSPTSNRSSGQSPSRMSCRQTYHEGPTSLWWRVCSGMLWYVRQSAK